MSITSIPPLGEGRQKRRRVAAIALATLAVGPLAACGDDDGGGGGGASSGPIKVGSIYSAGNGVDYSDAAAGTRAYFAKLNEAGGINGRKVEVSVENDGGDPAKAAAAARKLIGQGIVAMVGGASIVDCAVNQRLYESNKILNVPSLGSNPKCFASPNIVPVQNGAFGSAIATAQIAVKNLKAKRVQYITFDAPSGHDSAKPVQAYLKAAGNRSAGPTQYVAPGQDPTPAIIRAKRNNPDAIIVLAAPDVEIAIVKTLAQQGLAPSKIPVVGAATAYDARVPGALGPAGEGFYIASDYYPFEGPKPSQALQDFVAEMTKREPKAGRNIVSTSAWLGGELFTEAVKTAGDSLTRESFGTAFKAIKGFDNGMTANPITVGSGPPYVLNHNTFVVQIKDGKWAYQDQYPVTEYPPK